MFPHTAQSPGVPIISIQICLNWETSSNTFGNGYPAVVTLCLWAFTVCYPSTTRGAMRVPRRRTRQKR